MKDFTQLLEAFDELAATYTRLQSPKITPIDRAVPSPYHSSKTKPQTYYGTRKVNTNARKKARRK